MTPSAIARGRIARQRGGPHPIRHRWRRRSNPVAECTAYMSRHAKVVSFDGSTIGDETLAWTLVSGQTQNWTINVSALALGDTALCHGVRFDTHATDTENASLYLTPGSTFAARPPVQNAVFDFATGSKAGYPFFGVSPLYITCPASSHYNAENIASFVFPMSHPSSGIQARLRYWRPVADGVPVGDPRDVIEDPLSWGAPLLTVGTSPDGVGRSQRWSAGIGNYRFPFGKRIGLDVWVEVKKTSSGAGANVLGIGVQTSGPAASTTVSHGVLALETGSNQPFNSTAHSYEIEFMDGTWRPQQIPFDDIITFNTTDGHTIDPCYCEAPAGTDKDQIMLRWDNELPYLVIVFNGSNVDGQGRVVYTPADNAGFVQRWNNARSPSGTNYYYLQHPGGTWNHTGTTTFKRFWPVQQNDTGTFTDQTSVTLPDTVTVTRVNQ